jgi:hypothetical protein
MINVSDIVDRFGDYRSSVLDLATDLETRLNHFQDMSTYFRVPENFPLQDPKRVIRYKTEIMGICNLIDEIETEAKGSRPLLRKDKTHTIDIDEQIRKIDECVANTGDVYQMSSQKGMVFKNIDKNVSYYIKANDQLVDTPDDANRIDQNKAVLDFHDSLSKLKGCFEHLYKAEGMALAKPNTQRVRYVAPIKLFQ